MNKKKKKGPQEQDSSTETALTVEDSALSKLRPFSYPVPFCVYVLLLTARHPSAGGQVL